MKKTSIGLVSLVLPWANSRALSWFALVLVWVVNSTFLVLTTSWKPFAYT